MMTKMVQPEEIKASPQSEVQTEKVALMHTTHSPQSSNRPPAWLRGFANLRWRLTFVFVAILGLCLILLNVLVSLNATLATPTTIINTIRLTSLALLILGTLSSAWFTNVLLHPLVTIKDTSHAIAFGDLEQRARLPRQMDDEVGELAVNIDKIVEQIERARKEQQSSEQRARRFISDASHELRTPLTSLRGFTEVLIRGAKDDPDTMRRVLKLMKNEAERMTRLVNDMLTLARFDDGKHLKTQNVDLVDIAVESIEQARLMSPDDRKISLQIATNRRMQLDADPDRLKQVLHILLDNAIKYGRPGPNGWITLRLDHEDNQLLIQVIDNGKGIANEDLTRVFERFYRGQYTPLTSEGTPVAGAGLGLAIANAIVSAHKGSINVRSEAEKGTVFSVYLPSQA